MWNSFRRTSYNNDYSYRVYNAITDIDRETWELVTEDASIYLSYAYLTALENGMDDDMSFRYLIFYDKDQNPQVGTVLQIVSFRTAELLQKRIPKALTNKVHFVLPEQSALKLMICGNLFACGETGFAHRFSIQKTTALALVSNAISEMYTENNGEGKISFALFKEFWPETIPISDALKKEAFKDFYIDVNMVVRIAPEWQSFEDYLNAMNTKYRTRAKNVLKKSEILEKRDFSAIDIQTHLTEITLLYKQVLSKVDYHLGELKAKTFVSFKQALGEDFVFSGYFSEGQLIGFSTAFISKDFVDANFIGIDYEYLKKYKLYQRILYDYVDLAIVCSTESLRLGRTAETIKSGVGAKPVAMKLYTRHRNCISTELMGPVLSSIKQKEYEIRTPFK